MCRLIICNIFGHLCISIQGIKGYLNNKLSRLFFFFVIASNLFSSVQTFEMLISNFHTFSRLNPIVVLIWFTVYSCLSFIQLTQHITLFWSLICVTWCFEYRRLVSPQLSTSSLLYFSTAVLTYFSTLFVISIRNLIKL